MPVCRECGRLNPAEALQCEKCAAPLAAAAGQSSDKPADPEGELLNQLQKLLHQGQKIEAIKVYREHSGASLHEAKQFVESLAVGERPPAPGVDVDLESQVLELCRTNKINAIKLYRERTGVGLKEAKDAVESLAKRHGIVCPAGAGCGGAALVLIAAASLLSLAAVLWHV